MNEFIKIVAVVLAKSNQVGFAGNGQNDDLGLIWTMIAERMAELGINKHLINGMGYDKLASLWIEKEIEAGTFDRK